MRLTTFLLLLGCAAKVFTLAAPDGAVLVTWKRGNNVEWQLFDAGDKAIDVLQSAPGNNLHRHAAVVMESGEFRIFN